MNEQLKYQIALTMIPGIGPVSAKQLLAWCGSAKAVFEFNKTKLRRASGIGPSTAALVINFKDWQRVEEELQFIASQGIQPIFFTDTNYPQRLRFCNDGPIMIYTKGAIDFNTSRTIGIVGTRNITDYGKRITEELVTELFDYDVQVISGLAYGVDIYAHRAALKIGIPTVAVLAHGLDRIYPSIHQKTAKEMIQSGALVTEYISNTNPDRENFPMRNRIVAGLCDAMVVIESGQKGGALITADLALGYNRDVFAIPGPAGAEWSRGCNQLIRDQKATLVESAEDIAGILGWMPNLKTQAGGQIQMPIMNLEGLSAEVYNILSKHDQGLSIDEINMSVDAPISAIVAALIDMEFQSYLRVLPGKKYILN